MKMKTTTCATCNASFEHLIWTKRKYCSPPCVWKALSKQKLCPEKHITTACPRCGKETTHLRSGPRKFCSKLCSGKANGFSNLPITPSRRSTVCETCGVTFEFTPGGRRGRFCSMPCYGKWRAATFIGAKNPAWRGGYLPYYGPSWRPAMRLVRTRDKVCQDCGAPPKSTKALDVHHLVAFRTFGVERHAEANDPANLVALCNPCHLKREWGTNRREA